MNFKNAPKKRTTNFREDETKLLIQLWGSPMVQNKLYLTHRKAPVMRLIAANMQKHGFYRTPDEIKTRIRNLKCLYHRIKKSRVTGTGIGTVDPDWPHYKAMDVILSKKNAMRQNLVYNHNLLSEVNAEMKEEIEDIEIPEDGDSNTSNSNGSDDEFEESSLMPATITPVIIEEEHAPLSPIKIAPKPPQVPVVVTSQQYPRIKIAQNLITAPPPLTPRIMSSNGPPPQLTQVHTIQANNFSQHSPKENGSKGNGALPFPLLIVNGLPNGVQPGQNQSTGLLQKNISLSNATGNNGFGFNSEVSNILKEMLRVQKENLEIERERLEVERQKLEFERAVGSQLLNMVPAFNEIFQRINKEPEITEEAEEDTKNFEQHPNFNGAESNGMKRLAEDPLTPLKNTKVFKEAVINGIKKYMEDGTIPTKSDPIATDGR